MIETEISTSSNGQSQSQAHEEHQYLDLIRNILENGEHRPDRYSWRFQLHRMLILAKNRNRNSLPLRASSPSLFPLAALTGSIVTPNTSTTPPDHQAGFPPRRHRRTSLVHRRLDFIPAPLGSGHKDLGRQRQPRIPRQRRPFPQRSRRSGTRLWFPMAAFRRRLRGREDGLRGQGSRSVGRGH